MKKKLFLLLLCAAGMVLTACKPDKPTPTGTISCTPDVYEAWVGEAMEFMVTVKSTAPWTVSADRMGVTVNPQQGMGDAYVTISAPAQSDVDTVNVIFNNGIETAVVKLVWKAIPGSLSGVFSVSETKSVRFSMGNLQYTQSTETWSFAENQYDFIGTDNVTGGTVSPSTYGDRKSGDALADKIDLFGWSGSTGSAKWGIGTSTSYSDYSGDFVDWGQNAISNGDNQSGLWRTLTYSEWNYLLNTRSNASSKKGVACVNGVKGLILLPDTWNSPSGITFKSGFAGEYSVAAYGEYQTFTAAEWQGLESAGAVFLPASGLRSGTDVYGVGDSGYYWSATPNNESDARSLRFYSDEAGMYLDYRYYGQSVRLVQDVE